MRQHSVAVGLSHAMLTSPEWAFDALVDACGRALGVRPGWLWPLVDGTLGAYRRPPRDAHRELARWIEASDDFQGAFVAAREAGRVITLARLETVAASMAPTSLAVPSIAGLGELADFLEVSPSQLDWLTDTAHWNRRTPRGRLHHYSYDWLLRPGRTPRLLEVPTPRMRRVQRRVLGDILSRLPLNDAAHGFVPGRSAATGAAAHVGAETVITLDLRNFFARVPARRVFSVFRQAGYPEAVAHALTGLCTHAVPPWVGARMPAGGSTENRAALRRAISESHLPQGSPTSPALSNLAVRRLDSRLSGWAEASGAMYTRYADDLAFSGDRLRGRAAVAFIAGVERIVRDEGHVLNGSKTRIAGRGASQRVTGLVVNDGVAVDRAFFDELKAILHNCVTHGPRTQNRAGHPDFRAHLAGRLAWVESVSPSRGARLRRDWDRIDWS
ncbi:reverse transcriptase family protein [Agreia sp. VKM Ac-1783]|uniref:reverse transcriptase family protein n=1 Tax=Agreia sp. VKM Ac-1783 TaxID=1938889 RepID=UPI000A2AE97F|nr:reverse transcriptase family protein [Agreia sp. VKM Ac-1783]SMQ71561.1 RNA-directed DNA polymerase [Agreia sp. VKM Ac-1783]